ncbi:Gfa-like protein [Salmonella enterica]|nr:Gfa-like protein [Salmonella enterica]
MSGRLAFNIDNWQAGPDNAQVSGRLNILTQGDAGKSERCTDYRPGKTQHG